MPNVLNGQVVLVTGASRGIGRAIAVGLAAAGARVGLLARSREALTPVLHECVSAGAGRATAVAADVARPDAVRSAVQMAERDLGPVELLVNSAGLIDAAEVPPWQTDPNGWWRVVETNLRGPFNLSHSVLPGMLARGRGRIVNLSGAWVLRDPQPAYSAYSVSKSALARLTDNLTAALDGTGVRVFDLSPGTVRTDMTTGMPMFAGMPNERWAPVQRIVDVVTSIAMGRLDPLAGRFLHAVYDDLDALLAQADLLRTDRARTLWLRPYGLDDPVA